MISDDEQGSGGAYNPLQLAGSSVCLMPANQLMNKFLLGLITTVSFDWDPG